MGSIFSKKPKEESKGPDSKKKTAESKSVDNVDRGPPSKKSDDSKAKEEDDKPKGEVKRRVSILVASNMVNDNSDMNQNDTESEILELAYAREAWEIKVDTEMKECGIIASKPSKTNTARRVSVLLANNVVASDASGQAKTATEFEIMELAGAQEAWEVRADNESKQLQFPNSNSNSASVSSNGSSTPGTPIASTSTSPRRSSSRRPSIKLTLTDEEAMDAAAVYTVFNRLPHSNTRCDSDSEETNTVLRSVDPNLGLVLQAHEHNLFCERKERVCQSLGKLQEHEIVSITMEDEDGDGDISRNISTDKTYEGMEVQWVRSRPGLTTENVLTSTGTEGEGDWDGFTIIDVKSQESATIHHATKTDKGAKGVTGLLGINKDCFSYEINVADVGCYIKARIIIPLTEKEKKESPSFPWRTHKQLETSVLLGPVQPGPPRLLDISIAGHLKAGAVLYAVSNYIGGQQGASEFNWMRIRDGERQNMSEPVPLTADQIAYTPAIVNGEVIVDAATAKDDPRAYVVTSEDENCTFKVKCRPVRSDGCRGELFTSKPSKKIV